MLLVELGIEHLAAFTDMAHDYDLEGDNRYISFIEKEEFNKYLETIADYKAGRNLKEGYVPSFSYWLMDDNNVMYGSIRYRPVLTEYLLLEGGHIGYDIRPTYRNKGLATKMMTLIKEKIIDNKSVLVTCFADNEASSRVIEKSGGILENTIATIDSGRLMNRYWIHLAS